MEQPVKPLISLEIETKRLVDRAAEVVVANSTRLFRAPRAQNTGQNEPPPPQELRLQDVEAVLDAAKWRERVRDRRFFDYFIQNERYPTSTLLIRDNLVSNATFARLLVGQRDTLQEVDVRDNKVRILIV